jgi:hypothetical protein
MSALATEGAATKGKVRSTTRITFLIMNISPWGSEVLKTIYEETRKVREIRLEFFRFRNISPCYNGESNTISEAED